MSMQKAVAEVDRRTLVEEEPARGVKPGGMTEFTPRAILCGLVVAVIVPLLVLLGILRA
jgi:hypothetical protein